MKQLKYTGVHLSQSTKIQNRWSRVPALSAFRELRPTIHIYSFISGLLIIYLELCNNDHSHKLDSLQQPPLLSYNLYRSGAWEQCSWVLCKAELKTVARVGSASETSTGGSSASRLTEWRQLSVPCGVTASVHTLATCWLERPQFKLAADHRCPPVPCHIHFPYMATCFIKTRKRVALRMML